MTAPSERPRDPAAAEAEAERVLAMYRLQQQAESLNTARDLTASRWIIVGCTALFGGMAGALMGSARGHPLGAALAMALVGGLLAVIRQRAL